MINNKEKVGVLLLNLGGPERIKDVRPFLFNLFSDREIIRLGPFFLQKFIAAMIVRKRAPQSIANYQRIGGGSPILRKTEEQATALSLLLNEEGDFFVQPCMRYWHPFASEALEKMQNFHAKKIVVLPLYPHYSIATTGSSLKNLHKINNKLNIKYSFLEIYSWPDEYFYIKCLVERIREGLSRFSSKNVQILYSAHSLPIQFIQEGDPYVKDLNKTIAALEMQTGLKGELCYQSRSGPVEWLGPSLPEVIKEKAEKGYKNLLIVPISFVSDHVETLYEIDIEYRSMAEKMGIHLELTRGLNDDPLFISALRDLVMRRLSVN